MSTVGRTLTISNGGTVSDALGFNDLRFLDQVTIYAPETLAETVTVEVAGLRVPAATDWKDFAEAGTPVTLTAGEALTIPDVAFMGLRLVAGSAVAADRVFRVVGNER